MKPRAGRKVLAASFVMTFVSGCDSKSTAPPAAPTVDVGPGPTPSAMPSTSASEAPADAAPVQSTSATVATLPPAPSGGHFLRRPDGTCLWRPDVHCPRVANGRRIPCNPPPPHPVQCPDDAGP